MAANDERLVQKDWDAIFEILVTSFRDGISLDLFFLTASAAPIGKTKFYDLKGRFLDEYEGIEAKARSAAERERRQSMTASDHRQIQATIGLRDEAARLLMDALPSLRRILTTDGYTVEDPNTEKKKFIVIYPRDVVTAIKVVQELAQFGTLPEGAVVQELPEAPRLPALAPPPVNFQTVALPPGTKMSVEIPTVIDGEVIEDF